MAVDTIAPLLRSITVERSPEDAFRIFTERIGEWWPLRTYSVYGEDATGVVFEPGVGGRLVERSKAGEESSWGELLVWEPPHRVAYTWHPGSGPGDPVTEVEIHFTAVEGGTQVDLEHRGWEAFGEKAEEHRTAYQQGWPGVLERYAAATAA